MSFGKSKSPVLTAIVTHPSPLTPGEVHDLEKCEQIISKGWDTFIAVGQALTHIRDNRLYRADFRTFEGYCLSKWHYRKAHTYRLIGAAQVMQILSPIGDIPLPRNEAQVRPMLGLKPSDVQAVWRRAMASAGSKPITATIVKAAVTDYKHHAYSKLERVPRKTIPEEVILLIENAEKLLFKLKRSARKGDLNTTKALLYELRDALGM